MDPFTIITGVAGLLSFLGDSIDYVNSVVSAPEDRRALEERLYRLQDELQSIHSRVEHIKNAKEQTLVGAFGARKSDTKLFRRYEEVARPGGRWDTLYDKAYRVLKHDLRERSKFGKVWQGLKWKWAHDGLKSKVDEVVAMARAMRDYLSDDDAQTGVEILLDVKQIRRTNDETERIRILDWISPGGRQPTDFVASKYSSIKLIPDPFISTVAYKQWVNDATSENWHLSCYGGPGTGKSHRSRTIVWHLSSQFQSRGIPVLWLMFNHRDRSQHSLASIYSTLLRQLLSQTPKDELSSDIRDTWDRARLAGSLCPTVDEARGLLMQELKKHPVKFIVADALDEAGESSDSIHSVLTNMRTETKACIFSTSRDASRERYDMEQKCNDCGSRIADISWQCDLCPARKGGKFEFCVDCYKGGKRCPLGHQMKIPDRIDIEVHPSAQEVEMFVRQSLDKELDLDDNKHSDRSLYRGFTPRLQVVKQGLGPRWASMPTEISIAAGDSYLIADLITKQIIAQVQAEDVEKILDGLKEYSGASWNAQYDEMLALCLTGDDSEGQNIAYQFLSFLSRAQDTLSFDQLRHAIAVREGDKNSDQFPKRFSSVDIVRRQTRGLLTIGDFGNPEDLMVSFFHRTLAAYLDENGKRWFPDADKTIFDACLAYLRLEIFEKPFETLEDLDSALTQYPFASYAACHWCEHFRNKQPAEEDSIAVLEMLNDYSRTRAILQIAENAFSRAGYAWDASGSVGSLHICAFHGLEDLCRTLVEDGESLDHQESDYGQTPLHYAARRGHSVVVQLLLDAGADANVVSRRGHGFTPLMETIESGHTETIAILLSHSSVDVNIDCGGLAGHTALTFAARSGKDEMIAQLLRHDNIDVNKTDGGNVSALARAVRVPHVRCVKLLLQHPNINVNIDDGRIGAPLAYVSHGYYPPPQVAMHLKIAKLFLEHPDCEPAPGSCLSMLIQKNRYDLLGLLLNYVTYERWMDAHGRTLMHIAAFSGNTRSLEMVHGHFLQGSLPVLSVRDRFDNTPLHLACMIFGRTRGTLAGYLLANGADPAAVNVDNDTPLELAYQNALKMSPQEVFEIFKPYLPDGVDVVRGHARQSTVGQLIMLQDKEGVELFLQNDPQDVVLVQERYGGWTPLHRLMQERRPELLELVLPRVTQYIDTVNDNSSTPLHSATVNGFASGVELLLKFGANPDLRDQHDETAFQIAQRALQTNPMPALMLVNAGASLPPSENIDKDLLYHAVVARDIGAVQKLIDAGLDVYHRRKTGERTALETARRIHKVERAKATNEIAADPARGVNIDLPGFWKLVDDTPKVRTSREILEILQGAASTARGGRTGDLGGVSAVHHHDLGPLIQRLRKQLAEQDQTASDLDQRPSYNTQSTTRDLAITGKNEGSFGAGISKEERIAAIVMLGVVAIAWIWLSLHYQSVGSAPSSKQETKEL